MKKIVLSILVLLGALVLTGCQEKKFEFDFDKAKTIIEKRISNLEEIKKESLEDVYNIDFDNIEKYVFKQNEDGDFYAIIKAKDTSKVKVNMKEYFDKVKSFNENYSPERIEILDNRVEKEIDSYLVYIVHKDAEDIYKDILK